MQSYQRCGNPQLAQHLLNADVILGNEDEFASFVGDLGHAQLADISRLNPDRIFACTRGSKGACVYVNEEQVMVAAPAVAKVTDTTGAGDAWAAGFLYGLSQEMSLERSATLAAACAAQILDEEGGRPTRSWRSLVPA